MGEYENKARLIKLHNQRLDDTSLPTLKTTQLQYIYYYSVYITKVYILLQYI